MSPQLAVPYWAAAAITESGRTAISAGAGPPCGEIHEGDTPSAVDLGSTTPKLEGDGGKHDTSYDVRRCTVSCSCCCWGGCRHRCRAPPLPVGCHSRSRSCLTRDGPLPCGSALQLRLRPPALQPKVDSDSNSDPPTTRPRKSSAGDSPDGKAKVRCFSCICEGHCKPYQGRSEFGVWPLPPNAPRGVELAALAVVAMWVKELPARVAVAVAAAVGDVRPACSRAERQCGAYVSRMFCTA